jgi:hypothetical protein
LLQIFEKIVTFLQAPEFIGYKFQVLVAKQRTYSQRRVLLEYDEAYRY